MTRAILFAALAVVPLAAACTQGSESRTDQPRTPVAAVSATSGEEAVSQTEADIERLEREWVDAIVKKDAAALDRLLANDFNGTSPTAHLYTKQMAIDDVTRGAYVVDAMDLDEVSVNSYGDAVAVAFTSQEEKSRYGDTDISGHYHYTNVWVKIDGRWQAVASHGSRYDRKH